MQVRVFNGEDLPGALTAVKRAFGPNAFILRQRRLAQKRGLMGALAFRSLGRAVSTGTDSSARAGVQVTAALLENEESVDMLRVLGLIEPDAAGDPAETPAVASPLPVADFRPSEDPVGAAKSRLWGRSAYQSQQVSGGVIGLGAGPSFVSPRVAHTATSAPAEGLPEPRSATVALRTELISLRSELEEMRKAMGGRFLETPPARPPAQGAIQESLQVQSSPRRRPSRLQRAIEALGALGLEPEYARDIASDWFSVEERDEPGARAEVEAAVQAGIERLCRADAEISAKAPERRRVIAIVGPTGVGKTTTLAKLAAREVLESGRRVALLTCDTFRIAAVEQLRMYARIVGVPLRVIDKPEEMKACLSVFRDYDLILMDTPGISPKLPEQMNKLNTILAPDSTRPIGPTGLIGPMNHPIEKYLVLSSATKTEETIKAWKTYGALGIDRLILSKTDESVRFGCLLPVLKASGNPVAFLTNGQRVPEDLQSATASNLLSLFNGRHDSAGEK